jgi:hypothetical protein
MLGPYHAGAGSPGSSKGTTPWLLNGNNNHAHGPDRWMDTALAITISSTAADGGREPTYRTPSARGSTPGFWYSAAACGMSQHRWAPGARLRR